MDIVYVLGKGSRWDNKELAVSLRSLEKHLKGFDQVFVVGVKPWWIQNVIHIPAGDRDSIQAKEANIYHKVAKACQDERVSDHFVFFNDDHFLLQDIWANQLPNYYHGTIEEKRKRVTKGNDYRHTLKNTIEALARKKAEQKQYDIHGPMIFHKKTFLQVMSQFDWKLAYGYGLKSLYGNMAKVNGTPLADCKIDSPHLVEEIDARIAGRPFFSIGDRGLTTTMKRYLEELYPIKSRFEP